MIAALVFSLAACHREEAKQEVWMPYCLDKDFKQKVQFTTTAIQQVTDDIHLNGLVDSNQDRVVHFVSLVSGIISNTNFSLGEKVNAGQVLAELRSTELSSLYSQLKNLDAQIRVSQQKLKSVKSMYDDGISSQRDLLEAESDLDILRSEHQRVTSNLNLFSAVPEKDVFQIKAPVSGIITSKSIAAGSQISADGEPLFTISDLSQVWVMVNVYASNVRNIHEGMPVDIQTFSYPDEVFHGKIATVSKVYDTESRVLKARVVLDNLDLKLKPGMLVDVVALKSIDKKAISVPTSSLIFDDNQNFVVIYKTDCDVEIRPVKILSDNNRTTFISEGLNENEVVVTKNQLLIYNRLKTSEKK